MSGIAGVFNLNGAPVAPDVLERMSDAMRHRGPDGSAQWRDGNVGLAHLMLQTTPESAQENQPLQDESGSLCLVMDGRVDDREALRSELLSKDARLRDDTDAELVLKAYEIWGEESPSHIIGDFAVAIWDQRRQQLFCCRDFIGVKPFFYFQGSHTFAFASELHALLSVPGITPSVNEGMVGEFLASQITSREETLYRDILTLIPGHSLTVAAGFKRKRRFWNINPGKQIQYRSDEEYAEHFLEIMSEAVRCRLRTTGSAGAFLSGGLDSSTIVALSKRLMEREGVRACGFETFSNVFPSAPEADESAYIHAVAEKCQFPSNVLCPELPTHQDYAETVLRYRFIPEYPNGSLGRQLREWAAAKGFRVLLAGYGGDEWLCVGPEYYADLIRRGAFGKIMTCFRREAMSPVLSRRFLNTIVNYGLKPLLPPGFREFLRNVKHGFPNPWPWINPEFAQRICLHERVSAEAKPPSGLSLTKQASYYSFMVGAAVQSLEMEDRASAALGIEQRYPFDDRRFVEFAFALPDEQRLRYGQKFVLREAMKELLPETVRLRRSKGDFSRVYPEALKQVNAGERFRSLRIEKRGWVDGATVLRNLACMEAFYADSNPEFRLLKGPLWMVYSLEMWDRLCFNE